MQQFDRKYIFKAGKSTSGFETSDLHISFSIEKADTETPNSSKISLWNLSPQNLNIINGTDCGIMLYAGYGNVTPLLFAGAVSHVETSLDGADILTEIECIDGRVELRDGHVSLSYNGLVNTQKVFEDIANNLGITVTFSGTTAFSNISNGFSSVGSAKQALDKVCNISGNSWSIQNGVLQIKKSGTTMSNSVYVLSAETGLINIPKKLQEGAENDTDTPKSGFEVDFLLNGAINVSDFVKLESKYANGYFLVHSIEFDGDNLSGDWLCHAKLYEVK